MKLLLALTFFFLCTTVSATDYYISSSGNDTNTGLSTSTSWKTIAKVNSAFANMKPGDQILFNRGDTFYGSLVISKSGASGSPITIGAYGTGEKPIITGFTTVTAWTNLGNNIWESANAVSTLSTCNMVVINGMNTPMGRYPNTGYLTYQTFSTNISITSSSVNSAVTNWTGAEVVIKKMHWIIDKYPITNHSGGTITYSNGSSYNGVSNYGFFIQNDARTLDSANEWYYNPSTKKIQIYSTSTPINILVSSVDKLAYVNGFQYVTINGLSFNGSNTDAISVTAPSVDQHIEIMNCNISYSGKDAIVAENSKYIKIENTVINYANNNAIVLDYNCSHASILNNSIRNTGIIPGMGANGDGTYIALKTDGANSLIQYNKIDSTGFNGISFSGEAHCDSILIKNNFINHSCLLKDDGAGIYTYLYPGGTPQKGCRIVDNIVLNSVGNSDGTSSSETQAQGIYLDGNTVNMVVVGNTVANCANYGVFVNGSKNIKIENNTLYNNKVQLYFYNWGPGITGINVKKNIYFSKNSSQLALGFYTAANDISTFGISDSNYYAKPYGDQLLIHTVNFTVDDYLGKPYNLAAWQSEYRQDQHSINLSNIQSEYNYNFIGLNKFTKEHFEVSDGLGGIANANCTISLVSNKKLDGSCLLISNPSQNRNAVVLFNIGSIDRTKKYIVKFSSRSSKPNSYLKINAIQNNSPWGFTNSFWTPIDTSRTENQLLVQFDLSDSNVSLDFTLDNADQTVWIDNLQFYEVDTTMINKDDYIDFMYNVTKSNKVVTLSQPMIDVKGVKYVNSITLLPFTSAVLMVDPSPNYLSSIVGNTTPSLIEMTYNLSLANIVPATSAFTVMVNSAVRAVNSVVISETKVQLTLASAIAFGDVVTVAYSKPAVSPLQTSSAGQAASITAQAVTNNISAPVPVYISASVGNTTPSLVEMTYDLSLANIVPATTAFSVLVNSAARAVNAVVISGTKVQLTLANPIAFGDVVTVAYTKPATSPLQTTSAGQAASVSAQAVTNNISAPVPVYVSAAVGNATSSLLEMTYSLSLTNIVPATSAFTVLVNAAARTVNAVAISGTKVQLTLANPIAFGDVVTVAYTKPATSPLQTISAGQAASIIAQAVTNSINPPVPVYVSSAVGNATPSLLEMTYNLSLANIIPATSAFTVLVNSAARAVNAVAISGTKVQLTLSSAIAFGDVVTVAYTKPAVSPLQTTSAGLAASVTAQAATNNISSPVPVYASAIVGNTAPSLIEMTYNLSMGNIVPATSAFSVLVNSAARAVNAVAISGTKVQLTLASAIAFGDVVTVAYTKPASNPLQTTSAGQAVSISAQTVTNSINPPVPVYVSAAVGNTAPSMVEMTYNLSLANIVPATSAFTVLVNSATRAVKGVAISGTKVQLTLASAIAFGDVVTVAYTKPALSPLQTTSAGQVLSISVQAVTNNISAPVPLYIIAAVGNTAPSLIEMTYDLSLANILPATSAFSVLVNSAARAVNAVAISGTKVQLTLASAIAFGDVVTVAYTKPAVSPLQTNSAGQAASVTAQTVTNSTNPKGINGSHFVPVWQGENGTNHMNLIVVSATLENLPLSVDDEIAVFSGSKCVGSIILTKSINAAINSTFLVIPASQDDGSNNGFINNDSIIFKIWDNTNQREMGTNVVNYKNDLPTWLTSGKYSAGATSVVEIATFTENIQTIALLKGYNLISTYISPDDPNVSTVAKQLMDQGELIKVQDEAGNSFENWGSFGGWINKIGSFESTEGYKIKVANNCTLRVTGRPIVLPLDIPLKSGWNIISFSRTDLVDAMDIIQSLIDQNKLMKVQDEAGNSIENWGIFGGWKNAIGNFIPGKAYKVKSNSDAVITIHENYLKSATIPVTAAKAEYFLTKIEGNGTDHMNINIVGLQEAGISIGDELAAFDGDVCVGSLKITKNQMIDGTAGLVASASSDAQKPDGFKEGSIIRIVGWNKLTNKEFQVQTELLNGQLNYQKEASVLVRMKALTPDAKIIDDRIKTEVYPNPCNGNFTVRLSAIPETGGRIEILDISGRNILSRGILETAEEFNLDHQQPGIYIVKTKIGSTQMNHKLIIY